MSHSWQLKYSCFSPMSFVLGQCTFPSLDSKVLNICRGVDSTLDSRRWTLDLNYGRTHKTGQGALRIMNSDVSVRPASPPEQRVVVIATMSAFLRPACSTTASATPPCKRRMLSKDPGAPVSARNLSSVAWPPSAGSSSPSPKTHKASSFAFVRLAIEAATGRICFEVSDKSVA